ncbi:MAG: protein-tyrosine-phosphatase [Bacteroidota bacterium]
MTTDLTILNQLIEQLQSEQDLISAERKLLLQQLADYIRNQEGEIALNFICTHNSRRSHLAMIWAAVAADVFVLPQVQTFSGGTEATALNPRVVAALQRAGFAVENPGGANPHYRVVYREDRPALRCWSKTWDDPANPQSNFAAIMTCSDADENCPFIPGANLRLALTYEDPKVADIPFSDEHPDVVPPALIADQNLWLRFRPAEVQKYDERLREIGREILYAFSLV